MKGGKNRQPLGYTIIEVMIVLAVSGVMFLIAATFINGKVERTSFNQGVGEMASRIQGIIDQVTNGQYSDVSVGCTFNNGITTIGSGSGAQGTNANCVFLGKLIHICSIAWCSDSVSQRYTLYTVAGGRLDSNGQPINNLYDADPRVIDALDVKDQLIPQSLSVSGFHAYCYQQAVVGCTGPTVTAPVEIVASDFGFFLENDVNTTTNLPTGPPRISLYFVYPVAGFPPDYPITQTNPLNNYTIHTPGPPMYHATGMNLCLTDYTRYAEIILGTNNNTLSVDVKMDGTSKPPTC
jgi:prepilin-type N-terminal cleavage/methylation domain-containing protein